MAGAGLRLWKRGLNLWACLLLGWVGPSGVGWALSCSPLTYTSNTAPAAAWLKFITVAVNSTSASSTATRDSALISTSARLSWWLATLAFVRRYGAATSIRLTLMPSFSAPSISVARD